MNAQIYFSRVRKPVALATSNACVFPIPGSRSEISPRRNQTGVVLFLTLVALLAMSLAAVALIRSVDTSALITGNLSFKQASTNAAEEGIGNAIAQLIVLRDANLAFEVKNSLANPFNQTNLTNINTRAYHSHVDINLNLFDDATWNSTHASIPTTDSSGNEISHIIQRLCRVPNTVMNDADCLFSSIPLNNSGQETATTENTCVGTGCPAPGQPAVTRVTVRAKGPNHSRSFVQGFIY